MERKGVEVGAWRGCEFDQLAGEAGEGGQRLAVEPAEQTPDLLHEIRSVGPPAPVVREIVGGMERTERHRPSHQRRELRGRGGVVAPQALAVRQRDLDRRRRALGGLLERSDSA